VPVDGCFRGEELLGRRKQLLRVARDLGPIGQHMYDMGATRPDDRVRVADLLGDVSPGGAAHTRPGTDAVQRFSGVR
jgi:hypothetical protein